jgi:glutamate racemase
MKIGFFDSGLGGLLTLARVRRHLPQYAYVFFGDTANVPYGDKTEDEIYALTVAGVTRLFHMGAQLVIVACNTASSESLRRLQDEFLPAQYPDRKVLGVIIPTIEALRDMHGTRALLLATERTVASHKYERELEKIGTDITLISCATPRVVPLIEAGQKDDAITELRAAIEPQRREVDTVVLGCTHYGLLADELREQYPDLKFIVQDELMPKKVETYLARHPEIQTVLDTTGSLEIYLSRDTDAYRRLMRTFIPDLDTNPRE